MTPEERRELVRAQREVMWNLQKDYVVTVVRPGDDPVPYKRQGNPAVNTPQCVKRRQALRKEPLIQVSFVGFLAWGVTQTQYRGAPIYTILFSPVVEWTCVCVIGVVTKVRGLQPRITTVLSC